MTAIVLVACWGGERRRQHLAYERDRAFYLKQWSHALRRLRIDSEVVFVSNGGEPAYAAYLDGVRKRHRVVDRENEGFSQGAWAEGHRQAPGYDHYIVVEDDFVPVRKDFDRLMVEAFQAAPADCGFLCQMVATHHPVLHGPTGTWVTFPAMQNGVMCDACLKSIRLPASGPGLAADGYGGPGGDHSQIFLGHEIANSGFRCYGMGDRFRAPFMDPGHRLTIYHPEAPDCLLVPSEIYELAFPT